MTKPIPVWENNWEGWTSEQCMKIGHKVAILFCIGCGRPRSSLTDEIEDRLELVEKIEYDLQETEQGEFEVID